jgi:HEPN domain-containing protein
LSFDAQSQLDTATAFFLAGERCAIELKFGRYGSHTVSAPTIVTYAFSVELALKLIHTIACGTTARGHDLADLYDALPEEIRASLPHLGECVVEIARYFEDWRYPFEKELLFGDYENPRRGFIECYREIRRLRPQLVSVYEGNWGGFDPEWIQSLPEDHPRWELRLARA